jgi:putative hydrolase of the HAD superfamily
MDAQKAGLRLEIRPTLRVRSPRELLIFSLDDTLIDTSLYWIARAAFARAVAEKTGKAEEQIANVHGGWESNNLRSYEISPKHDLVSMHDTWQAFQKVCDIPEESDPDLYLLMAKSLRGKFPSAITGAGDLLKWAQAHFTLALLASGDPEVQLGKLDASNLRSFFKEIKVVPSKRPEDYRGVMSALGFSPRNSWVIGSSIGSDINPGIEAGANCIHYPRRYMKYTGTRNQAEEPAVPVFRIHELLDARAILAKPAASMAA